MKLLVKTSIYFILFSLIAFTVGGFIFYIVIKKVIYSEVDDSMRLEKDKVIQKLLRSDSVPKYYYSCENQVSIRTIHTSIKPFLKIKDTVIFDSIANNRITFRHLESVNKINTQTFKIDIAKSLIKKSDLIKSIFILMLFLSGSLYLVLFSVNFFVSKSVWIPFRDTISKLKNYKLAGGSGLVLKKTRITEFAQLNEVLKIMSDRIQQDFISLKEFTENASHEIQTPLAVIISRLELLIQSENLNELEMKLIQDTYNAAGRLSKLNQFLILLTKIENLQFRKTSKINIASVIDKYLSDLEEIIEQKNITITKQYASIITVSGSANSELQTMNYQLNINPTLADILVSNLISNAIKHNISGGEIIINISEKKLMISNTGEPLIQNPDELFERFKKARVDSESLGLGLSIVKKITEIYGMNLKYTYSAPLHNITISFPTKNNSMTND